MRDKLAKCVAAVLVLATGVFAAYWLRVRTESVSSYDLIDLRTQQSLRSEEMSLDEAEQRNRWLAGSGRIWAMRGADATAFAAARQRELAATTAPATEVGCKGEIKAERRSTR